MSTFIIQGGFQLKGEIAVGGAKNMATKVLAASLLSDETMHVSRVPEVEDVKRLLEILSSLGVEIKRTAPGEYDLTPKNLDIDRLDYELVGKFRASILLLAPLLVRFKKVRFPQPGGCTIGKRPIDLFIHGLRALGVSVKEGDTYNEFSAKQLVGNRVIFTKVSVTGTETLMLAAVFARGTTTLVNVAQEPEVVALAEYLNSQGARIEGAGSSIMTVIGVEKIKAGNVRVIPDRIEAGSYLALALATKSYLKITDCEPNHLLVPLEMVKKMGATIKVGNDHIEVKPSGTLSAIDIKTHEYPGFVTDMQAPFTVLMTQAKGQSLIHETVFESRLFYTDFLARMGAQVLMCDPQRVLITGPASLSGKRIESPDLRAGMAMVIAGLVAAGETTIDNIYQIERGYSNLVQKLQDIGAAIKRIE